MGFVAAIWLLVLGVLGASNLIIAKRPDAKQWIVQLAPYQGWIGAVSALWGVWVVIQAILSMGLLSKGLWPMIWWITLLADGVVLFSLGLLLGMGILKTFITQPDAVQRMDQMAERLAPKQGMLGLVAIGLGAWALVVRIVFFGG